MAGVVMEINTVISYWSLHGPETLILQRIKPKRWYRRQAIYCFMGGVGVTLGRRYEVPEDELVETLKKSNLTVQEPVTKKMEVIQAILNSDKTAKENDRLLGSMIFGGDDE